MLSKPPAAALLAPSQAGLAAPGRGGAAGRRPPPRLFPPAHAHALLDHAKGVELSFLFAGALCLLLHLIELPR